jgi:hypothetical protein
MKLNNMIVLLLNKIMHEHFGLSRKLTLIIYKMLIFHGKAGSSVIL